MIKLIKHAYNVLRSKSRDIGISAKRSSHWPKVQKDFLSKNPACAICGSTKKLNVHHCMPFHIDKNLELDPNNLITLCMDKMECHLMIGHGDSFRAYCPDIRKYAEQINKKEKTFEELCKIAKNSRIYH
jgi:hypothetical protein